MLNTMRSVFAALFGIQSNKNRVDDFSQGKATHFIIAGIIGVIIFILVLVGIVTWVLPA